MGERDLAKERLLVREWSYFKPIGPHQGENAALDNLNEMSPADVQKLIEVGNDMQEYIAEIRSL